MQSKKNEIEYQVKLAPRGDELQQEASQRTLSLEGMILVPFQRIPEDWTS